MRKFKIGDIFRISKYENIFAKGYIPNWSEEVFVIKKVKILCHGHVLLMILVEKKLTELFSKKNCKKQMTCLIKYVFQKKQKVYNTCF